MILVREATLEDAPRLAPRLRSADLREVSAVTRLPVEDVLRSGITASVPCHAVMKVGDDCPLAIFGVVPDKAPGSGAVWLLGRDEIVSEPLLFLRASRGWVERLLGRYAALRVVIDARNEAHLAWLRWCGFSLRRTLPRHGVEGLPFHEFVRARDVRPSLPSDVRRALGAGVQPSLPGNVPPPSGDDASRSLIANPGGG